MQSNPKIWQTIDRIRDLASKGGHEAALRLAEGLSHEYPDDEEIAYERDCLIIDHYLPQDGLAAANRFVERFPRSFYGRILLASAKMRLGHGQEALEELDAAVDLGAEESTLRGMRARALDLAGRKEEARSLLGSVLDLQGLRAKFELEEPDDYSSLEEALGELARGGETPDMLAGYRSTWLAKRGMLAEAENCLSIAISELGTSEWLVHLLSNIEFKNGKRESACNRLEELLARYPENAKIRQSIIWYYLLRGRLIKAASHNIQFLRYGLINDPKRRI